MNLQGEISSTLAREKTDDDRAVAIAGLCLRAIEEAATIDADKVRLIEIALSSALRVLIQRDIL